MSTAGSPIDTVNGSWFPLAVGMLCQVQMSFNAFNGLTIASPRPGR
ncbi:MAG TPA: hypothetical protein VK917_00745 [Ilumatobacter sp.]|nr:hypothetical protein [Ilumatobacter sp.]